MIKKHKKYFTEDFVKNVKLFTVLVSFGMLLDERNSPMDFSRGSEITEFANRENQAMEHLNEHKGLDLSSSVLDRLSQKVIR